MQSDRFPPVMTLSGFAKEEGCVMKGDISGSTVLI